MCKSLQKRLVTSVNRVGDRIDPVYSHNLGLFKYVMLGTCLDERCLYSFLRIGMILVQQILKSVESVWQSGKPNYHSAVYRTAIKIPAK